MARMLAGLGPTQTSPASITACPTCTPSRLPASSTSRCFTGSRSMSSTGASCTSRPLRSATFRSSRSWALSSAAVCRRVRRALASSSWLRSSRFSLTSWPWLAAESLTWLPSLPGRPASAHTGCTRLLACPRSCASQPAWSSSTIRVMASAR
ncbi:hypothetical protein G6F63_014307 [Rhizopus arrhizus]|nr:hypothetical protein G6F63_014307 [Rhizopus arrhizus]